MGEHSIIEIAEALDSGLSIQDITYIPGTVCKVKSLDSVYDAEILPGYEDMKQDKLEYARSFYTQYCNTDPFAGKRLVEPYNAHHVCRYRIHRHFRFRRRNGRCLRTAVYAYLHLLMRRTAAYLQSQRLSSV